MAPLANVPPGRAGRLWLRRRLDTAERGRDQLERKLRILVPELERRRLQLAEQEREWAEACREAEVWLVRAGVLGGQDAVGQAAQVEPVRVELRWAATVGVTYPADAVLVDGPSGATPVPGNAALVPATLAYRRALLAGARLAAAQDAARRVEAESTTTRRRLRALDRRWVPWLRESLSALDVALEQSEQEDTARLRRVVDRGGRQRP